MPDDEPDIVPHFRVIPGDPSAETVMKVFDARSRDWILTSLGDYQAAAVITTKSDGGDRQLGVVLEWPGRRNHTDEEMTVRLMMSPDDAIGLAGVLGHTGRWMLAAAELGHLPDL